MTTTQEINKTDAAGLQKPQRLHLDFLDGIRGLAALYVVFDHFIGLQTHSLPGFWRHLFAWTQYGHQAVDIFIVLSGFCLMLPVARSKDGQLRGGFKDYIRRRSLRILPPYYAAFVISFAMLALSQLPFQHPDPITKAEFQNALIPGTIFSHLLLVHNLSPQWAFTYNMALWSIGTEWQIYFVFPALLLPIWRRFGNTAAIIVGLLVSAIPLFLMPHSFVINCGCPWYIGLFAMGMAGAVITTSGSLLTNKRSKYLIWGIIPLLLVEIVLKHIQPEPFTQRAFNVEWLKDAMGGGISVILILCCVRSAGEASVKKSLLLQILNSRWVVALGTFSYSLYLIHCAVLRENVAIERMLHLSALQGMLFSLFIGIPTSIVLAYLFHLKFERPFMSGFQKEAEKRELGWLPWARRQKTEAGVG